MDERDLDDLEGEKELETPAAEDSEDEDDFAGLDEDDEDEDEEDADEVPEGFHKEEEDFS